MKESLERDVPNNRTTVRIGIVEVFTQRKGIIQTILPKTREE